MRCTGTDLLGGGGGGNGQMTLEGLADLHIVQLVLILFIYLFKHGVQ